MWLSLTLGGFYETLCPFDISISGHLKSWTSRGACVHFLSLISHRSDFEPWMLVCNVIYVLINHTFYKVYDI